MITRLAFALVLASASTSLAQPTSGQEAFEADCAGCHPMRGPSIKDGPSLQGVVWRKVASRRDFAYSSALKSIVGEWTPKRLDSFLKDTQSFAPGGGMFFTVDDATRRRAIIDYLRTSK